MDFKTWPEVNMMGSGSSDITIHNHFFLLNQK